MPYLGNVEKLLAHSVIKDSFVRICMVKYTVKRTPDSSIFLSLVCHAITIFNVSDTNIKSAWKFNILAISEWIRFLAALGTIPAIWYQFRDELF